MTVLDTILERKRQEVAEARARKPLTEVRREAAEAGPPRGFLRALREADPPALIAEIKRASPSKGLIREDFDPPALAREYERGGAACLSVLTDRDFFQGSLADLTRAREAVRLPVLRKDFLLDEYQVYEARAAGADAVLLIVAALDDAALHGLLRLTGELGMDALVEVHDEQEMKRAATAGASLIGVNNRDLRTFETDLAVTRRLAALAPDGALLVSESGIFTPEDVRTVREAGARAVLVGEALMREADVEQAVRRLLGR